METWEWIAVGVGAVAVVVLVGAAASLFRHRRRSAHLRDRFGPEYERAVSSSGRRDAERELEDVVHRREDLHIRPLPAPARDRYLDEWRHAESRFVNDPPDAVRAAERIVTRVLEERG